MAIQLPRDLDARVQAAVRHFWDTRSTQARKQQQAGGVDQGARSAVTGGAQMDGFCNLFADLALWAGARPEHILRGTRAELPGLFRPTSKWDLLINRDNQVVCAFKFACQAGQASEDSLASLAADAIANAPDLWGAYRRSAINFDIQPWLGCVLVIGDHASARGRPRSRSQGANLLPEFRHVSVAQRHELLCRRLVLERLYSDAAFLLANRDGTYTEPAESLKLAHLCRVLVSRVTYLMAA